MYRWQRFPREHSNTIIGMGRGKDDRILMNAIGNMAYLYGGVVRAADSAEQRLLQLMRAQARAELAGKGTDAFVQSQNIAHYRTMLNSGVLDEVQRSVTWKLLAEEETKLNGMWATPAAH